MYVRVCVCEVGTEVVLSVLLLIMLSFAGLFVLGSVQVGERSFSSQWLS